MTQRMKSYRLTDGTTTNNSDVFLADWGRFITALKSKGFQVIGFDPGFVVCDAATGNGSFELPLYAAKRLLNMEVPACPKCKINLVPGKALLQTWTGSPDFPGDSHAITMSPGGPGRLVDCLKCPTCGYSITT